MRFVCIFAWGCGGRLLMKPLIIHVQQFIVIACKFRLTIWFIRFQNVVTQIVMFAGSKSVLNVLIENVSWMINFVKGWCWLVWGTQVVAFEWLMWVLWQLRVIRLTYEQNRACIGHSQHYEIYVCGFAPGCGGCVLPTSWLFHVIMYWYWM